MLHPALSDTCRAKYAESFDVNSTLPMIVLLISFASIAARSIATLATWAVRSVTGRSRNVPPKVPNGLLTAERKTTSSLLETATLKAYAASAGRAEFPSCLELASTRGTARHREVVPAVRAVDDFSSFG